MPSHVGVWELPRRSPCLLTVRRAVRAWWEGVDAAGVAGGRGSVAVGVSGGADSLALLLGVLAEVGPDAGGVPVDAVVVDHGLQSGSGGVARRVAGVCEQLGARAVVLRAVIDDVAVARVGVEAAARAGRFGAFADAGFGRVLVGHTADDQAETFVLSASRGFCSPMRPVSVVGGVEVVRPLLSVRRADTRGACVEVGVPVWEDPHNSDERFERVRVRRRVMPFVEVGAVALAADDVAEDAALLDELADAVFDAAVCDVLRDDVAVVAGGAASLSVKVLEGQPVPIVRRVVARWLRLVGANPTGGSIRAVVQLIVAWSGQGAVAVRRADGGVGGGRLEVRRRGGKLEVDRNGLNLG